MGIYQISPGLSLSWNGVTTDSFHTRIFMLVGRLEKTKLARLTMCFAKHEKTRLIWFDYVLWVSCMKRVWVSGLAVAMSFVFQTHSHFEMTMCFAFCEFVFPSLSVTQILSIKPIHWNFKLKISPIPLTKSLITWPIFKIFTPNNLHMS